MERKLDSIAFEKYQTLFSSICSDFAGFLVIDLNGAIVWHTDSISSRWCDPILSALGCSGDMFTDNLSTVIEISEGSLYLASTPLTDASSQDQYGLIVFLRHAQVAAGNSVVKHDNMDFHPELVEILAGWMVEELQVYDDLESMALELGERYEELNLIYSSDDDVDRFSAAQYGLKRLVSNCVNFINVDMALLILPDKRATYVEWCAGLNDVDAQSITDELSGALVRLTREKQRSLVINSDSDYAEYTSLPNLGHKLISAPIFDGNHEVCGCIIVVKCSSVRNFTNSDRNLMHVVARKASKIIQSSYDKLTGLLTRSSFESIIDDVLSKNGPATVERCLIVLNIDQINIINELYGLKAGDSLIKYFGNLLEKELRIGDHVARLSGDEFGILAENCSIEHAKRISLKLQSTIKQHVFAWNGLNIDFSFRTGIVPAPHFFSGRYLLNAGDAVMGITARKGSGSIEVFRKDDQDIKNRRENIKWVHRIRDAFRNDLFRLTCQGVYDSDSKDSPHHYEVLIRMLDPSGHLISPSKFLPAAEQYRLLPEIDQWVVSRTIELLKPYAEESLEKGISWAINLSGQSISNRDFRSFLVDTLNATDIPTACLGFEVTESSTIDNITDAKALMEQIKSYGCPVYLDDFGTGLSSFSYMQMLPFDYVKIDGSFIRKVRTDSVSCAMVKAICDVVKSMRLKSVAEFVESEEDVNFLRGMGIDLLQGYFLHKPEDMKQLLENCFAMVPPATTFKTVGR